jgi:hypothetical protein
MENLTLEDELVREVGLRDLRELKVAPRTLVLLIERDLLE